METDFYITHDEKELIIECIEREIKEVTAIEEDDPTYVAYAECKIDHLKSLIRRIREEL